MANIREVIFIVNQIIQNPNNIEDNVLVKSSKCNVIKKVYPVWQILLGIIEDNILLRQQWGH